jgi:hypothetical protein
MCESLTGLTNIMSGAKDDTFAKRGNNDFLAINF